MFLRKFLIILRRTIRHSRLIQAGLLAGFWALGEIVAHATQIPVPGSVLGLFLVLALLACGRLQAIHLRRGANWLLADMLLFSYQPSWQFWTTRNSWGSWDLNFWSLSWPEPCWS